MYRIFLFVVVIVLVLAAPCEIQAQDLPAITNVAAQPFIAATERLVEALDFVGDDGGLAALDALEEVIVGAEADALLPRAASSGESERLQDAQGTI